MGVSTDGILFYGFTFSDDDEECDGMEELSETFGGDWDAMIAERLGVKEPEGEFSEDRLEEYQAYWDKKSLALTSLGASISQHCSGDYPMYYVAASQSMLRASRGYPEGIDPQKLQATPEWDAAIDRLCELMGIERKPSAWWLASYWG